ncbi:Eisosome component PIL1-domain-containing protein [Parasitella parasitica]|nr:Eisosome component PIL1-domain-containing protein [Parasitella parasitica]
MNFKDLQFSIGKFKADVSSQLAKNNPLQKQDTKALSLWIFQERNDLASMRTMAYERSETNKALKQWVKEEVDDEKLENGRDLEDIVGDKLCRLFDKQLEVDQAYAAKYQQYRHAVKSIREREEKLSDQREKKRSLQSRILNLSKTSPRSPKLLEFQKELKSLAQDTLESEMDLADFKRFALKEAFYLRFNALNEYAEKTALIAGFGKYLTDLIEIEPTPPKQAQRNPYKNGPEAAVIFADAMNALDNWKPLVQDERATLANNNTNNVDNGKGKSPATATASSSSNAVPPELPPRRLTQETIAVPNTPSPTEPSQPSGYTTSEITSVTSDLKTNTETEIELDKIDLYDIPPPAYDGPPSSTGPVSSPLNSDAHLPQQQQQHLQDNNNYSSQSFNSPYQAHANLPQQQQYYSPHPSHANLTNSPVPMHQQQHFSPPHQHNPWSNVHQYHQDSSFYDASNMMYSQINYQQLYRQVSQRQQHHAYRPYSEFQQQFNQDPQNNIAQQQRQRVDAGGFRIPSNEAPLTAEDEKERLAQHYKQQEREYTNDISHYGGSQYGGSVYSQQGHVAQQDPSSPPAPTPSSPPLSQTVQPEQKTQTQEDQSTNHEDKCLEE